MLFNYFTTAWRHLLRGRVYSALNIMGLAIGMAVALLIGLWVYDQVSYDRWLPGYQQAYQVKYNYNNNGEIRTQAEVCIPLAEAMKRDVPEVAATAMVFGPGNMGSFADETNHKTLSPTGIIAGEEFLKVLPYPMLEGSPEEALRQRGSVVLSESTAKALFGKTDPLNRNVLYNNYNYKVTGVIKDIPRNSSLHFDYITPFSDFAADGWVKAATTNWNHTFFTLYASLKPNVSYDQAEPKIAGLVKKYAPETYRTFQQQVVMQPVKDRHLYTEYRNGIATGGLIDYVRMFAVTGILVLLIACINFMNLSTARSEKRAREVGIRKVAGSSRNGLIAQFLIESLLYTFVALVLSLVLVQAVLPAFNAITGAPIRLPFSSPGFWLLLTGYWLLTGLLSGSRPAFYLSSFQPVKVLKGALRVGASAALPRKILVVLQFTCSIALIIGTIIVYQQIDYARNRPRGYDPDRLLTTSQGGAANYAVIKREALAEGIVSNMTTALSPATDVYSHNTIDNWPGRMPNEPLSVAMNALFDTDYFATLKIQLLEGRNFTGNYGADSTDVILNEAAVRRMRLKHPINAVISWSLSNAPHNLRVIGVAKDALTNQPFAPAEPTIYVFQPWTYTGICRLSPNIPTNVALDKLRAIYTKYNPNEAFEYHFVDENYAANFALENLIGRLAGFFAALAIFISCLGLFGLAAYVAEQRTKEIGIRKVLGASVGNVFVLITKDFVFLVLISCLIASPIAWYFLQQWLHGYYYRITIGPAVFVVAAGLSIVITTVTISFQAIKAALMNPVRSLKVE